MTPRRVHAIPRRGRNRAWGVLPCRGQAFVPVGLCCAEWDSPSALVRRCVVGRVRAISGATGWIVTVPARRVHRVPLAALSRAVARESGRAWQPVVPGDGARSSHRPVRRRHEAQQDDGMAPGGRAVRCRAHRRGGCAGGVVERAADPTFDGEVLAVAKRPCPFLADLGGPTFPALGHLRESAQRPAPGRWRFLRSPGGGPEAFVPVRPSGMRRCHRSVASCCRQGDAAHSPRPRVRCV